MIDRLILSAVLGTAGWHGLFPESPEPPKPLTVSQLMKKGKAKSISDMCAHKEKTTKVKEMCARWAKHQ